MYLPRGSGLHTHTYTCVCVCTCHVAVAYKITHTQACDLHAPLSARSIFAINVRARMGDSASRRKNKPDDVYHTKHEHITTHVLTTSQPQLPSETKRTKTKEPQDKSKTTGLHTLPPHLCETRVTKESAYVRPPISASRFGLCAHQLPAAACMVRVRTTLVRALIHWLRLLDLDLHCA